MYKGTYPLAQTLPLARREWADVVEKIVFRKMEDAVKQLFSFLLAITIVLSAEPLLAAPIELGASVQLTGQFANT